jgi:peptidoglycan/xylan/chitin deacetylase (PgdA/CDA1 family)
MIAWPNGARLAVVLTSEYEPVYEQRTLPGGFHDYRFEHEMTYEAKAGIWRILDVLGRHRAPSTFFTNGGTAEKYPETIRAIVDGGHEVAAHSWSGSDHFSLARDAEEAVIVKTTRALEKAAGVRPTGWLTPRGQVSANTVELIVKHGYHYHGDCFDDDVPYAIDVGGKPLVEVPRSLNTDDYAQIAGPGGTSYGAHRNLLAMWTDEFDVLYAESAKAPRMFTVCWHQGRLGRPALSKVLDELLVHIGKRDGIWYARGEEIAQVVLAGRTRDPVKTR